MLRTHTTVPSHFSEHFHCYVTNTFKIAIANSRVFTLCARYKCDIYPNVLRKTIVAFSSNISDRDVRSLFFFGIVAILLKIRNIFYTNEIYIWFYFFFSYQLEMEFYFDRIKSLSSIKFTITMSAADVLHVFFTSSYVSTLFSF